MKKIYFAALAMALTACVSNEDLNPVDNYGYIDVNVSNDPVMVTRGNQPVTDVTQWTITTKKGNNAAEPWSSSTAYVAGTYTVAAQNYASETAWKEANGNYGAAFYQGVDNDVEVSAGTTVEAEISCGTAQNAKLTVTIADMPDAFSNVVLTATRDASTNLEFSKTNDKTEAFFGADEVVSYSLSYKYNNTDKSILNQTITMAGAATNNVITISANTNGLISVSIKYDDAFGTGNNSTIQFDAATGEQVTNS